MRLLSNRKTALEFLHNFLHGENQNNSTLWQLTWKKNLIDLFRVYVISTIYTSLHQVEGEAQKNRYFSQKKARPNTRPFFITLRMAKKYVVSLAMPHCHAKSKTLQLQFHPAYSIAFSLCCCYKKTGEKIAGIMIYKWLLCIVYIQGIKVHIMHIHIFMYTSNVQYDAIILSTVSTFCWLAWRYTIIIIILILTHTTPHTQNKKYIYISTLHYMMPLEFIGE